MSIGDLLVQGMQQTPMGRLNRPLAPPDPGAPGPPPPQPQPGAPAPSGPPSQAPAQVYGPDPSTAMSIQALMQMHAQDRRANSIDRGLAGMAASFGPLETRAAIMQSYQPQDDRLGAMLRATGLQEAQTGQTEHRRAGEGAEAFAQNILGQKPGVGTELFNTGQLGPVVATAVTPTDQQKQADAAAAAYAAANPGLTPAEIAHYKAGILTSLVDPAAKETAMVRAKDVQEFKDSAIEEFPKVNQKLTETQTTLDQLLADPSHTMAALTDVLPTTGQGAAWNPLMSQKTKNQAVLIDKLKASLTGDNLRDVKNVRNVREFDTLGKALTAALDSANSPEQVQKALQQMKDKVLDARATAELAAGHHLTGDLVGRGSRDLLDKKNPYYTGASEDAAAAVTIQSPGDIAKLAHGTPFIIPDGPNKGKTGYAQ